MICNFKSFSFLSTAIHPYSLCIGSTGNGLCTCEPPYFGERCESNLILVVVPTLLAAILIVGGVITLVTLLLIYVVRRERYRAALANNDWKIEYSQVRFSDTDDGKSFRSLMSMQSQIKRNRFEFNLSFNEDYTALLE